MFLDMVCYLYFAFVLPALVKVKNTEITPIQTFHRLKNNMTPTTVVITLPADFESRDAMPTQISRKKN